MTVQTNIHAGAGAPPPPGPNGGGLFAPLASSAVPSIPGVSSRSELMTLLSEACELEHGLACSYLYTAFTLKQDLSEGGMTWQQQQMVRKWASQIYFVASQEMLHLALAWNLLAAIGGMPCYLRPNFPQRSKYYPLHLPLKLERFGVRALQRFIYYEHPMETPVERAAAEALQLDENAPPFRTVGELYGIIRGGFEAIPETLLFLGDPERQVGADLVDFPGMVRVVDRASANAAIDEITEQGEGTVKDRVDCHYGMFLKVLEEFNEEKARAGDSFQPVRPAVENPQAKDRGDYGAAGAQPITDLYSQQVAELFDSVYIFMLRLLTFVFSGSTSARSSSSDQEVIRGFSAAAIRLMPTVIKPLGEALTLLPAGPGYPGQTAGPAFGISRHVMLAPDAGIAAVVARERLAELTAAAEDLAAHSAAPGQLQHAAHHLRQLLAL